MAVLHLALFNPLAAGMQYVMTVALYPPVAWMLLAVHRGWVRAG